MLYKLVFLSLILSASAFGQQVRLNPFSVTSSDILEEMKKVKISNSKISPEELSKLGDELISAKGLNFTFHFNSELCQKMTETIQKQKDKSKTVRFNAQINSVEGDIANITLPEIQFPTGKCGSCFARMPLSEFGDKEFVSFIQDRIVRFYTPKNLIYEEVNLVSNQNPATVLRTWKVPFHSVPIGISDDGLMIVLQLPSNELSEIALLLYDNGTFRFYPKKDLDLTATSEILKKTPEQINLGNSHLISFTKEKLQYTLKYNTECQ